MIRRRGIGPSVVLLFILAAGFSGAVEPTGLRSVFFEYGSSAITADSEKTLLHHAAWMKDHADVILEIQGWDDFYVGKGDGRLSVKRAEAVRKFFTDSGIEEIRLLVRDKGAAPWDPTRRADPKTFRRVDFVIVGRRAVEAPEPPPVVAAEDTQEPIHAHPNVDPSPDGEPESTSAEDEEDSGALEKVEMELAPSVAGTSGGGDSAASKGEAPAPPESAPTPEGGHTEVAKGGIEEKPVSEKVETQSRPSTPEKAEPPTDGLHEETQSTTKVDKSPQRAPVEKKEVAKVSVVAPVIEKTAAAEDPGPPREEKIELPWEKVTVLHPSPKPRWGHSFIHDPPNHRLVLYGGTNGKTVFGDLWMFDLEKNSWMPLHAGGGDPGPLAFQTTVYDPKGVRMIVFGGSPNRRNTVDSTWLLSLEKGHEAWVKLEFPVSPGPRAASSSAYDGKRNRLVLFGGCTGRLDACRYTNDLWELHLKSGNEQWDPVDRVTSPPPGRESAILFLGPSGGSDLILLGGFDGRVYLRDSWVFNRSKGLWIQMKESITGARCCTAYVGSPEGGVFFGGNIRRAYFQDTWLADSKGFRERKEIQSPGPRAFAGLAPSDRPDVFYLFGGQDRSGALGDFWALKIK